MSTASVIYVLIKAGAAPLFPRSTKKQTKLTGAFDRKTGVMLRGPRHPIYKHPVDRIKFAKPIRGKQTWDFDPADVIKVTR